MEEGGWYMSPVWIVFIEGTAYGPYTEKEVGEFYIEYEASFEFFPKPLPVRHQLIKITGADAAELHIAPMKPL